MNIIKIDDLSILKGIEALKGNFEIPEEIKLYIAEIAISSYAATTAVGNFFCFNISSAHSYPISSNLLSDTYI